MFLIVLHLEWCLKGKASMQSWEPSADIALIKSQRNVRNYTVCLTFLHVPKKPEWTHPKILGANRH